MHIVVILMPPFARERVARSSYLSDILKPYFLHIRGIFFNNKRKGKIFDQNQGVDSHKIRETYFQITYISYLPLINISR